MKGVNDRKFLNQWRLVLDSTNPGLDKDRWRVGDVQWSRARHNYTGPSHAFSIEVHTLERQQAGQLDWRLLVVTETWWDSKKEPLRTTRWARVDEGSARTAINWIEEQSVRSSAASKSMGES